MYQQSWEVLVLLPIETNIYYGIRSDLFFSSVESFCWILSTACKLTSLLILKLHIATQRTIPTVTGVFDAIEKKYLKDFYFILYTDQE